MVKHNKAQSFKISKLKNLFEKPRKPSEVAKNLGSIKISSITPSQFET